MTPGGYGRGRRHRGMGRCLRATPLQSPGQPTGPVTGSGQGAPELTAEEEARMLEEEEMMLKQEIDDLDRAIADLRKNKEKEVNK